MQTRHLIGGGATPHAAAVRAPPEPPAVAQARGLVLRYGWNAMSYQILNPGIRRWFAADGSAVIGYADGAGYRVVAGAPVCAPERLAEVAEAFAQETRRAGLKVCYFGAQDRLYDLLAARGQIASVLLGAQPCWDPRAWPAVIAGKASLRAQLARARNKGVTVSEWPSARANAHPELQRCLHEWLETRGLPPMHFLVEWNVLARLLDRRIFVAERDGAPLGFVIATPVPLRDGWLIEQIIRGRAAPNGTAEMMLDAAMRAVAADGAGYVTLGLSPLSRSAPVYRPAEPLAVRLVLAWTRAHGRRFYNFEGLERFKAKFQPEGWEPIYAVTYARRFPLRAIYAIAAAFGGTSPVWFVGQAMLRALVEEVRRATAVMRRSA